jgi:cysteine desulfurase/selenocysteine lyase
MTATPRPIPKPGSAGLRKMFPILAELGKDGRPLAYLDNAASSQKPLAVIEAMNAYYRHDHANVHRGVHTLGRRATEAFERARGQVAAFLSAQPNEIVFTRGTTEALNLAAHGLSARLQPGDEILLTELEHHSNIVPWQMAAQRTGARVRAVPVRADGSLDLDAMSSMYTARTRIVAFGHVSNALGTVHPVAAICEQARRNGAITVVDGAQGAAHGTVDVGALGCDLYAISGHKMYGPTGIGALWGRRELLEAMPPWQGGGEMIKTVTFEHTTYADPPARFEAGTPNIAGAVGLGAAAEWMTSIGRDAIAAHERLLLDRATAALLQIPGVRIVGTAAEKAGVISFVVDGFHPHDVATLLDEQGVAVRSGHHCTQPLMRALGVDATARASFAAYTTPDEIDRFTEGLAKIVRLFT